MRHLRAARHFIVGLMALLTSISAIASPAQAQSAEDCFRLDNDLERLICIGRAVRDTRQPNPEQAFLAFEQVAALPFRPSLGGHRFFLDSCTLYSVAATADGTTTALLNRRGGTLSRAEKFDLPRGLNSYQRVRLRALEIDLTAVERLSRTDRPATFDITMRRGQTFYTSNVSLSLSDGERPPVYASRRDATFVARQMASMFDVFFDRAVDQRTLSAFSRSADALQASLNLPDDLISPTGENRVTLASFERRTEASKSGRWPFARGQTDASSTIFDALNRLVQSCQSGRR